MLIALLCMGDHKFFGTSIRTPRRRFSARIPVQTIHPQALQTLHPHISSDPLSVTSSDPSPRTPRQTFTTRAPLHTLHPAHSSDSPPPHLCSSFTCPPCQIFRPAPVQTLLMQPCQTLHPAPFFRTAHLHMPRPHIASVIL